MVSPSSCWEMGAWALTPTAISTPVTAAHGTRTSAASWWGSSSRCISRKWEPRVARCVLCRGRVSTSSCHVRPDVSLRCCATAASADKKELSDAIHKVPLLDRNAWEGDADEAGLAVDEVPCYVLDSRPGDAVLFDFRIWHGSWRGGEDRRMFSLQCDAATPLY